MDDTQHVIEAIQEKARFGNVPEQTILAFLSGVNAVARGESGNISEGEIEPVRDLPCLTELPKLADDEIVPLERLAVIKLNGGLGTGMGLDGPKSLLRAKDRWTFLDLIVKQVLHYRQGRAAGWPALYLMNSFSTQGATLEYLERYSELREGQDGVDFLQGKVPKLYADTLLPVSWPTDPRLEWCPPGHGDIYAALQSDPALIDRLLSQGYEYLFVSNSDNLGATISPELLSYFAQSGAGFMVEVARRTVADKKGGHLARRRSDGRLILREIAQCPPEDREAFGDSERYTYFNTNNLWVNLPTLKATLDRLGGVLPLSVIANSKTVDPRNASSPRVIQIETAMGAAIECFTNSLAVEVPRTRFAPVKSTADLLSLWSDVYELGEDFSLRLVPSRIGNPPEVILDSQHYKCAADFEDRFKDGVPSLLACDRFEVVGECEFEAGVSCVGVVRFENRSDVSKRVKAGEYRDETVLLGRDL